ncbi:type III pantothenate kinase [Oleiagrimonas sp. C23AA]|uniref:type III pantothenate kinase n=1 Tax=Oleiagrimonas sp. C23AA TaxID=2719047 RepID=UPI0014209335|nr:type III pantothenate kinase [Oleiagrimonas sp. C23AA]NII11875.1 type III pantothenate kinase [Oleiagrimonas sp. C23AA]
MRLLVDLGNTRLKWAFDDGSGALDVAAAAWSQADYLRPLQEALRQAPALSAVWLASVVDHEREVQVASAVQAAAVLHWVRTPAQGAGVINAYAQPQRLGVDRFLGMVAARAAHAAPCVLVGCGTALTLDALSGEGLHLGGLIAPGPRLMQQSVLGATAQVRPADEGAVVDAADNTADGLVSGCWHAAAALVERFYLRMQPRLGEQARLWLGGGDAQALAALIERPVQLHHHAVLHGLRAWADAQG